MSTIPLATLLRPEIIQNFIGQEHLLGPGKPLCQVIQNKILHSMILWGPPGTGKTTLTKILANSIDAHFVNLSAVMVGLREIREVMQEAFELKKTSNRTTVLFIDEVHRFNKGQQDAFLPYVEDGTVIFIGATTENPSFEINNALLSRCRVYVLKSLSEQDLLKIINRAINEIALGSDPRFGKSEIVFDERLRLELAKAADGDARQALNFLEQLILHATGDKSGKKIIDENILQQAISGTLRRFDKGGDNFYDQISALHKSVRGSSPDGALYWLARMLDGGADPLYIARRIVRMASEDIGNADPKALTIALNAWDVEERLGSPEGELALAQAVVYLAVAPKSNAVYTAFNMAMTEARQNGSLPVPLHLRNAPTKLMKSFDYGKEYRYDHDEENAFAAGQTYFPDKMGEKIYYKPVSRGLEIKIGEKLKNLRSLKTLEKL